MKTVNFDAVTADALRCAEEARLRGYYNIWGILRLLESVQYDPADRTHLAMNIELEAPTLLVDMSDSEEAAFIECVRSLKLTNIHTDHIVKQLLNMMHPDDDPIE